MIRILLVALFVAIPALANAQAADGLLGPTSTSNGQSVGSSSAQSSNLLQPASKSDGESLQSTGTNGVTQSPDQSALQRPASAEETKLFISGDIDTEEDTGEGTLFVWAVVSSLALAVVIILVVIFRNKLRLPVIEGYEQAPEPRTPENIEQEPEELPIRKPAKKKKKSKKKTSRRKSK